MHKRWLLLPLVTWSLLLNFPARAVYAGIPPEITVVSDIMFGSKEEYVPKSLHEEGDYLYYLESWELEPVTVKPREKHIEQEVLYEGTEAQNMIPEKRSITAKEDFSGMTVKDEYPVLRMKKVKEEWKEDFSFPVVFHSYGAEEYELGGVNVAVYQEPLKLEAYEEALLSEIGAAPENYRVTKTAWAGAPYMDENDVLCRNAVAYGRRRVADYLVTYGGTVTFPEVEGFRCRAVYRVREFERKVAEEKAVYARSAAKPADKEETLWIIRREMAVYTVSFLLVLAVLLALVYLIKKHVDKKMQYKEADGQWHL